MRPKGTLGEGYDPEGKPDAAFSELESAVPTDP